LSIQIDCNFFYELIHSRAGLQRTNLYSRYHNMFQELK